LRKKETWAEKLMWRWLRDRRFSGYKFRRQHSVGNYYLDFFCDEAMLAIELDGLGHGHPDRRRHEKLFWFRAASKCCVIGIPACGVTLRTFAKPFSERCSNARLIRYRLTHVRRSCKLGQKRLRKLDELSPSPRPSPPRRGRIVVRSSAKLTRL